MAVCILTGCASAVIDIEEYVATSPWQPPPQFTGTWRFRDHRGEQREVDYVNGQLHGKHRQFTVDGLLYHERTFEAGKLHGPYFYIVQDVDYFYIVEDDGQLSGVWTGEKFVGTYRDGKAWDGSFTTRFCSAPGSLSYVLRYRQGVIVGPEYFVKLFKELDQMQMPNQRVQSGADAESVGGADADE